MKKWWILLVALGLLAGCSEENTPVETEGADFIYPVAVGNMWEYKATLYNVNIRGDSAHLVSADTITSNIKVVVSNTVQLPDLTTVYQFQENIVSQSGDSIGSRLYYRNESNGLFLYAFQHAGFFLPKSVPAGRMALNPKISAFPGLAVVTQDSLIFPDAPFQALQYPLELGARWVYFRTPEMPYNADKLITDSGNLTTLAGKFDCYEIQELLDINEDDNLDYDYQFYDYVSPSGLVKRVIYIYNVEIPGSGSLDPLNPPVAVFDQVRVIELKQVELK